MIDDAWIQINGGDGSVLCLRKSSVSGLCLTSAGEAIVIIGTNRLEIGKVSSEMFCELRSRLGITKPSE